MCQVNSEEIWIRLLRLAGLAMAAKAFFFAKVLLQKFPAQLYALLVTGAVLNAIVCPFTILLNVLVMVTVTTKRRLPTHANILLACLAVTDVIVGPVVQPLYMPMTVFLLRGESYVEFCDINLALTVSFAIAGSASLHHLAVISGEPYFAVKHTFTHGTFVTKVRLLVASALAWFTAIVLLVMAPHV